MAKPYVSATNGSIIDDCSCDSTSDAIGSASNKDDKSKPQPTQDEIIASIRELLNTGDLKSLTAKIVRHSLVEKFGCDMSGRKNEINDLLMRCMKEKQNKNRKRENSGSSADDSPTPKKMKKEKESSDSDNSLTESPTTSAKKQMSKDEEMARDLSLAEHVRPRRAAAPKPKPIFKSKKKATDGAPKKKGGRGGRKMNCSPELQAFIGCESMPRHEIVKFTWDYLKAHPELRDKKNKQWYHVDETLAPIFKCKKFKAFGMMKHISNHMFDLHEIATEPAKPKKPAKKKADSSASEAEQSYQSNNDENDDNSDKKEESDAD